MWQFLYEPLKEPLPKSLSRKPLNPSMIVLFKAESCPDEQYGPSIEDSFQCTLKIVLISLWMCLLHEVVQKSADSATVDACG